MVVNILNCYAVARVFCIVVSRDMQIYRKFHHPPGLDQVLRNQAAPVEIPLRSVAQTVCDELHDQIAYLGLKVGSNP